jgi:tetratricopeptide (TPR) repeat protein
VSAIPTTKPALGFSAVTWAAGAVVFAAAIAYHNSFSGPFMADDILSIAENSTIRHFGGVLSPPSSAGVGGRPLLNLTFALNYYFGGLNVWGYHAVNLLIHMLAALTLFGIVRRTLLRPTLSERFGPSALPLAFAVAVIWALHPLQTEAVTFISQRAESLMGLFYLLTLYCFIRGVESRQFCGSPSTGPEPSAPREGAGRKRHPGAGSEWQVLSVAACFLGALTKEIIMTAPVMVLLYDRTFVAGSFREAWRMRRPYYLGLAGAWVLLAGLMMDLNQRAVGFNGSVTAWRYALTSCRSIVCYLGLALWPHPLVFDYGTDAIVVRRAAEIAPYAIVLFGLLAGAALSLWRWPAVGFAAAWFFVILAPASSVVPVALQPMAEYRMYLPLAAIVALAVLGLHRSMGPLSRLVFAAAAVGLGWLSIVRNNDYRSELVIWADTVAKCPNNERAQNNLARVLANAPGGLPAAAFHYEAALRIKPNDADVHNNLGAALLGIPGRLPEAVSHFEEALRIRPDFAGAHNNLGNAWLKTPGRVLDAMAEYKTALRIDPTYAGAHINLGNALLQIPGRAPEAMAEYRRALQINPNLADAHYDLGCVLAQIKGRVPEAIAEFQAALQVDPGHAAAHYNLGCALLLFPECAAQAIAEFEAALRSKPDFTDARINLGYAWLQIPGHTTEARANFAAALRARPDLAEVRQELDRLRGKP